MAPQTAPARQNLPLETSSFIGRERDLSDLLRLLGADRVVTLVGVSGIGKTRLALRVAAQATASYPDGVWLADLADVRTDAEIISRVATAVGVAEEAGRDLHDTVHDALRGRRLLLVLDHCDDVVAEVAGVVRSLVASCPLVSLLLTSSEPVRIADEVVWRVPPLSLPGPGAESPPADSEAVRLFLDRAGSSGAATGSDPEELRAVADICRRLGGLPLCVEIVAAWVRRVPLAQMAERLAPWLDGGPAGATPPSRSRILRSVLDWSHTLLNDAERVMLRRLSVFRGWDLELAERVCSGGELAEEQILDLVSALVDRSLICLTGEYHGRVRYRLPRAVRDYAAERLAKAGEAEELSRAHRVQLTVVADELGRAAVLGRAMPWAERFGFWHRAVAEYDNLRAALHGAANDDDPDAGLRLCCGLRPFWVTGYHFAEGIAWYERFLAMEGAGDELRGAATVRLAELYWARADHTAATALAEKGLPACRAAGDTASMALALNLLAMIDVRRRDYDRAGTRLAEVLRLARDTGDLWNEAVALGTQGALSARLGDVAGADVHYNTALMIMRGMDHRWGVGVTLIGQAIVAEARGDMAAADRCYREALDIQRDIGAAPELANCLAGVGRIAYGLGATAQAYDYLSESLLVSHGAGQRWGVASGLASVARVAAGEGMIDDACRLAGAAATIRETTGVPMSAYAWPLKDDDLGVDPDRRAIWWDEGRELGVDDAVAMALRVSETARLPRQRSRAARRVGPPEQTLTRRELEIARLIGEGHGNRTIAGTLFITPATVARHVANINRKTGFTSRKQIAAWINGDTNDTSVPGADTASP